MREESIRSRFELVQYWYTVPLVVCLNLRIPLQWMHLSSQLFIRIHLAYMCVHAYTQEVQCTAFWIREKCAHNMNASNVDKAGDHAVAVNERHAHFTRKGPRAHVQ